MGRPQPKGGSIAPGDHAKLGGPSFIVGRCCVCGTPGWHDKHHDPPKSRIPKVLHDLIPRYSLCGFGNADPTSCHGNAHRNGGIITFDGAGHATVDERAAGHVNPRRAEAGLPAVMAGVPFPCNGSPVAPFVREVG